MNKKTEWRFFHIFQYEEEAAYLRQMHAHGWEFEDLSFIRYRFRECEPRDMVYQLDYNQEGLAHREEYLKMFADCGWEHMGDHFGYSYFRKPADEMTDGEEGIFCDDESRLEMMRRIVKGRLTPLLIMFLCIVVPQLFVQSMLGNYAMVVVYLFILALYIAIFAFFGSRYIQYQKKLK